jgi:hypothetical protein
VRIADIVDLVDEREALIVLSIAKSERVIGHVTLLLLADIKSRYPSHRATVKITAGG